MSERKLTITTSGKYQNIDIRNMDNDDFIFVTKRDYVEGREIKVPAKTPDGKDYSFFSCSVTYDGQPVGLALYPKDHDSFKALGGIGDTLKITCKKGIEQRKGKKGTRDVVVRTFVFEKV